MEPEELKLLSYSQARNLMQRIRAAEVPVEHAVSLPMPTKRTGSPGFAHFAAAAARDPEGPTKMSPPDRWWVIDAKRGRLLIYALSSVSTFAAESEFHPVVLDGATKTVDELRDLHSKLEAAIDDLLGDFFTGNAGDAAARAAARGLLESAIPEPLTPVYRNLAPDFFDWLA